MGDARSCNAARVDAASIPRPTGLSEPIRRRGGRRFETDKTGVSYDGNRQGVNLSCC